MASTVSIFLTSIPVGIATAMVLLHQRTLWGWRCTMRREVLHFQAVVAFLEAVKDSDYEIAVGALAEWNHHIQVEIAMQDSHDWSLLRPFRLPPDLGEEW